MELLAFLLPAIAVKPAQPENHPGTMRRRPDILRRSIHLRRRKNIPGLNNCPARKRLINR